MKKNRILFTSLLLLLFANYSCEKEELQPETTPLSSEILKNVNPVFLEHDLSVYKIKPIWDSFITFDNRDAVEVNFTLDNKVNIPTSENRKVLGRQRLLLSIINGKINETIIEYIPSDNFTGKMKDINIRNLKSKHFDGRIIFRNANSSLKTTWLLTNGKIVAKGNNKKPKKPKNATAYRWVGYTYEVCTPYYNYISAGNSEPILVYSHMHCEEYSSSYWVDDNQEENPTPVNDPYDCTVNPSAPWCQDGGGGGVPIDPPVDECANAENVFDSSFGQSMDEDISSSIELNDGFYRKVKYTRHIYSGYGMNLYSVEYGVHKKTENHWEWESITHDYVYPVIDNSLFVVTHTVNSVSAVITNPNTARIAINYNVKAVLECFGIVAKTKEENHNNLSVKSPVLEGD